MSKDYQDVKSSDKEDEDHDGKVDEQFAPPRRLGPRRFRGRFVVLVLLGLTCVVAIAIVAFGVTGWSISSDIGGIRKEIETTNQTIFVGLNSLKKAEMKDEEKFTKVDKMVKNVTKEMNDVKSHLQEQISKLQKNIRTLNCNLEDTIHNRTGGICCPKGWRVFDQSCYWFSKTMKTWEEAKANCEDEDSHLLIISGYREQIFVTSQTKPRHTWIGLRFENEAWKWVDGTTYTARRADWRAGQPRIYPYHASGDVAHCAHLYQGGLWNTEHCLRHYYWACETRAKA